MKKLIVLAAVIASATVSQAALVNWGYSGAAKLTVDDITYTASGATVKLYMVGVNKSGDVLIDTRTTLKSATGKGKLNSSVGNQDAYTYQSTVAGGLVWDSTNGDLGREYYAVITYTVDETKYTYKTASVASSGLSDTSIGTVALGSINKTVGTSGTGVWIAEKEDTPEPTSAVLMLLGVAGLALRRRSV